MNEDNQNYHNPNHSLSKQQIEVDESYSFSLRNYVGHKTAVTQGRNSVVRGTDTLRSNHSQSQSYMNEEFQRSQKYVPKNVENILNVFD